MYTYRINTDTLWYHIKYKCKIPQKVEERN